MAPEGTNTTVVDRIQEAALRAASLEGRFIKSDTYKRVAVQFSRLFARRQAIMARGLDAEARGLLVVGESGAGKTRTLSKVFEEHEAQEAKVKPATGYKVLSVRIPSPPSQKTVGLKLLEALDYPMNPNSQAGHIWEMARKQLRLQGYAVLHLDEAQDVQRERSAADKEIFRRIMKDLRGTREWPILLVFSGTNDLLDIMSEAQLVRRLYCVHIPPISISSDGATFQGIMDFYANEAGLKYADELYQVEPLKRLFHAGNHQYGWTLEYLIEAMRVAMEAGQDEVSIRDLAETYRLRKDCEPSVNPFLATNWQVIDTRSLRDPIRAQDPGLERGKRGSG